MRMYHIIINGELVKTCPAYGTHLEVQHDLTMEHGGFVRVREWWTKDEPVRQRSAEDE